jgi:hypothetical protein
MKRVNDRYQQAIHEVLGIEDPALAIFIYTFIDGLIMERLLNYEQVSLPEQCTLLGKMIAAYLDKYK